MTSYSSLGLCELDSEHIMDHYKEVDDRNDAGAKVEDEILEQVVKPCASADITVGEDGCQMPGARKSTETCKSLSSTGSARSDVANDSKTNNSSEEYGPTLFQQVLRQNEGFPCPANDSTDFSSASRSKSSVENAMNGDMQSIVVTPASSILYPTAVTVSFSSFSSGDSQSEELSTSLSTASEGCVSNVNSSSISSISISTGVTLSDSDSEACAAINSCSASGINTAISSEVISMAEDESEAEINDGAASLPNVQLSEESLRTAKSLSSTLFSKKSSKAARSPLLEVDDLHTAVEVPFVLHTAWERTADTHTLPFVTEKCMASDEHSESFASAQSSSGCGPMYCSFIEEQEELHEIKSQPNLGSSRG